MLGHGSSLALLRTLGPFGPCLALTLVGPCLRRALHIAFIEFTLGRLADGPVAR